MWRRNGPDVFQEATIYTRTGRNAAWYYTTNLREKERKRERERERGIMAVCVSLCCQALLLI